jgi:hypothetical protein
MSVTRGASQGLRLPSGQVTVLLVPAPVRHAVLDALDAATARRPGGPACGVVTVTSHPARTADERVAALEQAATCRPAIVLVARMTDGLDADDRRRVLAQLRALAAGGAAVLVDDADPVAALSIADGALRAGADGSLLPEALGAAANASVIRRVA